VRPGPDVHSGDDEGRRASGARPCHDGRATPTTPANEGNEHIAYGNGTKPLCSGRALLQCTPFELFVEVHHLPLSVTAMRSNSRC